jgi:hypothetical protein
MDPRAEPIGSLLEISRSDRRKASKVGGGSEVIGSRSQPSERFAVVWHMLPREADHPVNALPLSSLDRFAGSEREPSLALRAREQNGRLEKPLHAEVVNGPELP